MSEEMNLYKRCKNIFKFHGVDMGGGESAPEVENAIETHGLGWTEGEATTIEWDGDTSGLVSVADSYYKVANYTTIAKADLIGCVLSLQNDDNHPTPFVVEERFINDSLIPHAILVSDYVIFVSEPTSYGSYNFEESGIYFGKGDDRYASSLTYITNKTIHKIDQKYIPGGSGGEGNLIVTAEAGSDMSAIVASSTYSEMVSALLSGRNVTLVFTVKGFEEAPFVCTNTVLTAAGMDGGRKIWWALNPDNMNIYCTEADLWTIA